MCDLYSESSWKTPIPLEKSSWTSDPKIALHTHTWAHTCATTCIYIQMRAHYGHSSAMPPHTHTHNQGIWGSSQLLPQ